MVKEIGVSGADDSSFNAPVILILIGLVGFVNQD